MAEVIAGVAIASSIIQLIDVGSKVVSRIKEYADTTKDIPQGLREISVHIPLITEICQELREDEVKKGSQVSQSIFAVIDGCNMTLLSLDKLCRDILPSPRDSGIVRARKAVQSLRADKKFKDYQRILETYKTSLMLHISQRSVAQAVTKAGAKNPAFDTFYHFPSTQVSRFIAREKLLRAIEEGFSTETADSRPNVVTVIGMGGQGKSQLALEFCRKTSTERRFEVILWVDATNLKTLHRSFDAITEQITAGKGRRILKNASSISAFIDETLEEWKASWLLVFDNFDQPGEMKNISDFFPRSKKGAILLTSRHADSKHISHTTVHLHGMEEKEAKELLFARTGKERTEQNDEHADAIVKMLGCLPLAIDQAAAYVTSRNLPLGSFIEHYSKRKAMIMKHTPQLWEYRKTHDEEGTDTSLNAFTTWELDFQQIKQEGVQTKSITHILTLFAFFDILKVSEDLFSAYYKSCAFPPTWMEDFVTDGEWDSFTYGDVIASLLKLSLLQNPKVESHESEFSIHPLIRDWIQMRITAEQRRLYIHEAIQILTAFITQNLEGTIALAKRREILSHLDAIMVADAQYLPKGKQLGYDTLRPASHLFATFYDTSGRFKEAEELLKRILDNETATESQNLVDIDSRTSLETLLKLSQVYFNQGRYEEATEMAERCYEGYNELDDTHSPEVAAAAMNLAETYYKRGRNADARKLFSSALDIYQEHLPAKDLRIYAAEEKLAGVLRSMGDHEGAFTLYRQALAGKVAALGQNHVSTLRTGVALANNYRAQCQYKPALEILLQAVSTTTNLLGHEHPDTLNAMIHLGILCRNMGKAEEAEKWLLRVVEEGAKALGGRHPDILRAELALGMLYVQRGREAEAEPRLRIVVLGRQRYLGVKNDATVRAVEMLGYCLWETGQRDEVEELCMRSCDAVEEGGEVGWKGNRYAASERVFRKSVAKSDRNLGKDHPDTLDCVLMLAQICGASDRVGEARQLFQRVLNAHIKRLGLDDFETVRVLEKMAGLKEEEESDKKEVWKDNVVKTTKQSLLAHQERLPLQKLSQCFRDAINVTKRLGFRYIWIDALCIAQDSPAEMQLECSHMKDIYQNCTIMLAANYSEHPNAGLYPAKQNSKETVLPFYSAKGDLVLQFTLSSRWLSSFGSDVIQGALSTRGWTLQERVLAPRILHFGKSQLHWECRTSLWSERTDFKRIFYSSRMLDDAREVITAVSRKKLKLPSGRDMVGAGNGCTEYTTWYALVSDYSCRKISFPEDRLRAVLGLAELFLQIISDRFATVPIARLAASSWSWAAIDGELTFNIPSTKWGRRLRGNLEVTCDNMSLVDAKGPHGTYQNGQFSCRCPVKLVALLASTGIEENEEYPYDHLRIYQKKEELWEPAHRYYSQMREELDTMKEIQQEELEEMFSDYDTEYEVEENEDENEKEEQREVDAEIDIDINAHVDANGDAAAANATTAAVSDTENEKGLGDVEEKAPDAAAYKPTMGEGEFPTFKSEEDTEDKKDKKIPFTTLRRNELTGSLRFKAGEKYDLVHRPSPTAPRSRVAGGQQHLDFQV
ncbi:hypothetical protein V492_01335 [Pseudogymnoascus sp. VKM F-4246]|nr:hypothetical protein V492_01335 [Pseudogymnoascus sp. VKM F-4246]